MNGKLLPEPSLSGSAVHVLTNDPFIIHFVHRWWAWIAVIALVLLARRVKQAGVRPAAIAIHSAFGTQMLLGIATVMTQVNIVLAVLHQAVGALVVAATIWGLHILGRAPKR
jgi:cytochrome c oxidase assembly protein subunit 15